MKRKRRAIRYRKSRCLLSDVLPHEVPLSFSNRNFYDFIERYRVECDGKTVSWIDSGPEVEHFVHLLFSLPFSPTRLSSDTKRIGPIDRTIKVYNMGNVDGAVPVPQGTIPFRYKIAHKDHEFRDLAVPHPRHQVEMMHFYDTGKETLLYLCSRSPYSIRRPVQIARCVYHKDSTHYADLANDAPIVEQSDEEYEHLRSFFVYGDYSNVYKFYESPRYHRCEKKFERLLRLDISKCFDSIYTHSIAWAVLGQAAVKEHLQASRATFPGRFDTLMQRLNYDQTNGIIIGPEFSRIFAEVILQTIDCQLESELRREPKPIRNKVDYELLRYVDDYFLFYTHETDRERIVASLQHLQRAYGLYLNMAKSAVYEKPLITEISRAKRLIANLIDAKLKYTLTEVHAEGETEPMLKGDIYIDSRNLIVEIKTILKVCGVEYRDVMNFALAVVEKRVDRILKDFTRASKENRSIRRLTYAMIAVMEVVFFAYSVSPRVNATIKLCRVLRMLTEFCRSREVPIELRHAVFKAMFDDVMIVLRKVQPNVHTQVEALYLLIALGELGREYLLEESVVAGFFGIKNIDGKYELERDLHYFSITVLLFYMGGRKRYTKLREFTEKTIKKKFATQHATRLKDAEMTMLLLDVVSCPHVTEDLKQWLLGEYGIADHAMCRNLMNYRPKGTRQQLWFTSWTNFDFGKELDRKRGYEVY